MFWKNPIILINGSAIEKDTNAVQKFVSEKESFSRITSLSLLLFAFFTVGQYIRPNTEVHSDLWRAYGGIRSLPEGYNHLLVNHSVHFVDPDTQAWSKICGRMQKYHIKLAVERREVYYHRICKSLCGDNDLERIYLEI